MQLCRDVYHCTPSALREQDAGTILRHLECLSAEAQVREAQSGGKGRAASKPARARKG